jgi:hypothetical protein
MPLTFASTICVVCDLCLCAQLLRFKATATESGAENQVRGSEKLVVEQAIRLIEGGQEENGLDR